MKNIKILTKLISLIILISIIFGIMGVYSLRNLKKMDLGINDMFYNRVKPLEQLKYVSDAFAINIVDAMHKVENGNFTWNEGIRNIEESEKMVNKYWNAYLATKIVGEERRLADEAIEILRTKVNPATNQALDLLKTGKDSLSVLKLHDFNVNTLYQNIDPMTAKINQLIKVQIKISDDIMDNANLTYQSVQKDTWITLIISILLVILFATIIIVGISASLKRANQAIFNLEKGNLIYEIEDIGKDEIGVLLQNLKSTIYRLRDIVRNINIASNNIGSASVEVSSSSQELSQGTSEQASSTEEVSSSMEEMAANIQQNSDNAEKASIIAQESLEKITTGSEHIFAAINAMKEIAEKISIVNEIAFQTNILALNASVEAARAGEHGKGFAVVAEEVRNLAQSSKEAAKEISIVVQNGLKLADDSDKILKDVMPKLEQTTLMVKEINYASKEQNSGVAQINNAIQDLNQVVQQGAAAAEEMASSSEELSSQAETMLDMIAYFKVNENGNGQIHTQGETNKVSNLTVKKTYTPPKHFDNSNVAINMDTDKLDNDFEKY